MSSNPVAPKTSKKNEMDFEIFMEALRMSHAQSMKGLMSRQNKKIMVEYNRQMKKQLRFVANSERTFILPHEEGEEKSAVSLWLILG
uniref:Inhibitor_I29 domain-containing protein n=1 Tax=Bursaphelenchus xylophilus TaxID=6326 RepID=A0A1I7SNH7_BURXY